MVAIPAMIVGMAKTMKLAAIDNPKLISKPPNNGPTMAPIRPAPTAQPTPVALIWTGYIRAAKLYMPTKPPWIPKPSKAKRNNIIEEPLKNPKTNIKTAVKIK